MYKFIMIRTRAIIKNLSYDALVKAGVIPDLSSLIHESKTVSAVKKYAPFIYSNINSDKFSFFGMLLDYIIRAALRINLVQDIDLGTDIITDIIPTLNDAKMIEVMNNLNIYNTSNNLNAVCRAALIIVSALYDTGIYTQSEIDKYVPTLVNIMKELLIQWESYSTYLSGSIRYNTEYSYDKFSGHPDVVTDLCVLDIKTTASFSKMAKESCLQVLSYYSLMKQTVPNIQYVGFILPMQRTICLYNITNWNHTKYLEILNTEASNISSQSVLYIDEEQFDLSLLSDEFSLMNISIGPIMKYSIGSHISKGKNIATTLTQYISNRPGTPCQMFLRNPRTGNCDAKTAGQIAAAAEIIKNTGLQYFTHAPYVINLCANASEGTDFWQQRILNEDLASTVKLGGRGVVVHTGARKHLSESDGLIIMEYMVRQAVFHATESCPLLLETPCGEGTEVVCKIEELGNFFYRFTEQERSRLGICIDTCHVISAGYDPLEYLQHWETYCKIPIRLVHFNDSKGACGCHTDRHASPGEGHIGIEKMIAIAEWCYVRSIPMVTE